jgi:hypothetical protein
LVTGFFDLSQGEQTRSKVTGKYRDPSLRFGIKWQRPQM